MTAVVNQVEMPLHVDPHPLVAAAATFFRQTDLSPAHLFCIKHSFAASHNFFAEAEHNSLAVLCLSIIKRMIIPAVCHISDLILF